MKKFLSVVMVLGITCVFASAATLDDVITNAAREICRDLPKGTRIAIVNFDSESDGVSDYIMEELTYAFVENDVEVADRTNLPYVRQQLALQTRGDVSDRDGQQIGKFIGAQAIVTGQFIPTGGQYRFRVTAVSVEKATRLSGARFDVSDDPALQKTLTALRGSAIVSRPNQGLPQRAKTAGNYLDEGLRLASQRRFADAIEAFTRALELDSGFHAAYLQRGLALIASISKVTDVEENFASFTTVVYGKILSGQEKAVMDRAIADFNQAIRLDQNVPFAYLFRGGAYYAKGDHDRAIADYTEAIRLSPAYASAYSNRGSVYNAKGDYDRAITDFDQAIRISRNDASAYNNRGGAYYRKGDYDQAIEDYTKAIRLDPNDATSYSNRGRAYESKGDYDRAMADYDQAVRLDPNFAPVYSNRGGAYYRKGEYDLAIADFNQAIRLDPNYATSYSGRGGVYYGKGEYDLAIADFNHAVRLDPNNASAYYNRGTAYYSKGDYDRAVTDFNQAVRLRPNDASAYTNRGAAYYSKGDYDLAIADWEAALRINPNAAGTKGNIEAARKKRGW
jgi:tetratricopeptide (TPR) repeat protein